jgi:hypothetical protein
MRTQVEEKRETVTGMRNSYEGVMQERVNYY